MKYLDSHCHLNSEELRHQVPQELQLCRDAGVAAMVVVGTTLDDSCEAVELSRQWKDFGLRAACGIHPHDSAKVPADWEGQLKELMVLPEVCALGEIGLDYYYDFSPRDVQRRVLSRQLELAHELDSPVIFHVRDAFDDFWSVIDQGPAPRRAVLHCFGGTLDDALKGIERGWFIGVTGVVTFAKADEFRSIVAQIPVESLLCETDCPWMAPVPYRGKTNRPSWVVQVYQRVAQVKGLALDDLTRQLWLNGQNLFGLETPYV